MSEITIEEIRERLEESEINKNIWNYVGFNMNKGHQDKDNKIIDVHNKAILNLFSNFLPKNIEKYFDCFEGTCFLTTHNGLIKEFGGWKTEDIIYWLANNNMDETYEEPIDEEVYRVITQKMRYEVLKRQKWRCNSCNQMLKYNVESEWSGKVGHIDHIFPYSKRKDYPNGEKNINELSNLQALCPTCNLKKGDKHLQ